MLARLGEMVARWPLPFALVWLELAFKAFSADGFSLQIVPIVLFSVAGGLAGSLLASLFRSATAEKAVQLALLLLAGIAFTTEHFVWLAFGVYFDLTTITAGAADMAGGFAGESLALILSPTGILRILVFLVPAIVYAVAWAKGLLSTRQLDGRGMVRLCASSVLAHLAALAVIVFLGASSLYWQQFSFKEAVRQFGLVASISRDASRHFDGSADQVVFEDGSVVPMEQSAVGIAVELVLPMLSESPEVRLPAELDIDFDALAETTDGTWADLDRYVASLSPSMSNSMTGRFAGYNLIFISAEAFSAEAIREDVTPTLYRMATQGIQFTDYYQFASAGTTGGECANIFGLLPTEGGASVKGTSGYLNYLTMGSVLDREGYEGWAFHNNDYTYYSRDITHNNLGYSHGFMGYGNGMEQWVTDQWPQSDLEMVEGTFLNLYGGSEPFNVYYMSVSAHGAYSIGGNAMSKKNWDVVEDLPYSETVRAYLASNVELDRAMEWLIGELESRGMADRTVIVISTDHFPYGLDGDSSSYAYLSELYGHDIVDDFDRDHNRLIIWSGSLEHEAPIVVDEPVSSIDVLPTLLNLFGCEWDSRLLPGRDVFSDARPLVFDISYNWRSDLGTYYAGMDLFVPVSDDVVVPEGYVERTCAIVRNKVAYCRGVLTSDYYRHVFGNAESEEISG